MAALDTPVMEEIPEEVQTMLDTEFFPTIADVIDRSGGLCRLDLVCTDMAVATLRDSLPAPQNKKDSPYRMTKLLSQVPQFFTLLDGNDKVCTALGYDNQYVDAEHNICEKGSNLLKEQKESRIIEKQRAEYMKSKGMPGAQQDNKRQPRAENSRPVQVGNAKQQQNARGGKRAALDELRTAAADLQNLAIHGSAKEFANCVRHCQDLRQQRDGNGRQQRVAPVPNQVGREPMVRGGAQSRGNTQPQNNRRQPTGQQPLRPQPAGDARSNRMMRGRTPAGGAAGAPPEGQKRERRERGGKGRKRGRNDEEEKVEHGSQEQNVQVERLMRMCIPVMKKAAGQKVLLSNLADVPEIRNQKKFLNGVSFGRLFDHAYPAFFDVENDPTNNQMSVTLVTEPPKGAAGSCPPNELPLPFAKKKKLEEAEKDAATADL